MGKRFSKCTTNKQQRVAGVEGGIGTSVVYLRLKGHWGEWEPLQPQWQHWGDEWLTQDLSSPWTWETTGVAEEVETTVDGDISLWLVGVDRK